MKGKKSPSASNPTKRGDRSLEPTKSLLFNKDADQFFLPNVPFKIKCIYLVSFKEGPLEELAAIYWEIEKRGQGGKRVGCLQQSCMGSPCDLLQDQARVAGAGACLCWTS